jgi:PAS domain S-box-containing protein
VKNPRSKHKITLRENASGGLFKCASILKNKELSKNIDRLIKDEDELNIKIVPFHLTSGISEKLFIEGIDFVLLDTEQLSGFLKKINPMVVLGLPIVLVADKEEIEIEDVKNLRIIDILLQDNINKHTLLKTQILLQSTLHANLLSFFDHLNKDSFFEALFGKLDEAVSVLDEKTRYIWINESYHKLLGYSLEELSGRTPAIIMEQDDLNRINDSIKKGITNYKAIHHVKAKNGRILNVELSVFIIVDKNTGLVRMATIKRKIRKEDNKKGQLIWNDEIFQKFIKNIDDLIIVTDSDGKITYASPGYGKSLGYREGELEGTLVFEYIDPQDIKAVKKTFSNVQKHSFEHLKFRIRKKNGEYIWLEAKGESIYYADNKDHGLLFGASIIQDKLLSEERLKDIESKYKILIGQIYDLIFEVDQRGIILNVIGDSKNILKRSVLSLIGKKFIELVYKEDSKIFRNNASREFAQFQIRIETDGKKMHWFETTVQSFTENNRNVLKMIILKDIHEKKKILKKIHEEESLYRSLTENIQDVIIRVNIDLDIVYANTIAEVQLFENQPVKNLKALNLEEDVKKRILGSIKNVKLSLKPDQYEIKISRQDKAVYYNWSVVPEFNEHSEFFSYLIVARNVTPFVVAKHEITKLYNIIEQSTNSIIITDRDGNIEYVNAKVEKLTGFNHQDLLGMKPSVFKSGKTHPNEYKKLWATISSGNTWKGTFCNKKKNGEIFWEFAIISPITNFEGEIINYLAVKEDITQQKNTEEILHSNQKKLNLTLEAAHVGTWTINIPEEYIYWDDQVVKLCGYEVEEMKNGRLGYLRKIIHPEDVQRVTDLYKQSMKGYDTLDIEFKVITKLGLTKNVFAKGQVIRDDEGKPVRMDGISMDITNQKAIEENLKLRNEELNQFVYKVSHDLRAPLASIRGIIELEKLQNKNESQFKYVHLIEDRISNLDQFMRNILSHSRNLNTSVKYKLIDFRQITNDCFKELEFLRNALSIKRIVKIPKFTFYSDESRIFEIFRNLISNSIKYLDYDKTEPYIKITVKKDPTKAFIIFEDNGVGIDPELQNYIFDMFYRANEKSDGSGIGLYIVKQAVEKLNGTINVKSKKGEGTRFLVTIPNANPINLN